MALFNLLLLPVLVALGLFKTDGAPGGDAGAGSSGGAPADGSGTPPPATNANANAGGGAADQGAQGAPAKPDAGPAGGPEALRADLAGERDKRQSAERERDAVRAELEQIKNASKSESDKAIDAAKKAGASEAEAQWASRVIRSEAKSALSTAGAADIGVAVAAFLDEHRDLKVNDQGDVEELAAKVTTFTKAHPTLFTARVPSGNGDGGAGAPPPPKPAGSLEEAVTRRYSTQH